MQKIWAKSKWVTWSPDGNRETFNGAATRNELLRETSILQRRVRTRKCQDDPFFSTIQKLGEICEDLSVELGRLINNFVFMADDAVLKGKVYDIVPKIDGLGEKEVVKVGAILSADTVKTNYHFLLPSRWMLLGGSQ